MSSIHIIYASTSGHTEFVCKKLRDFCTAHNTETTMVRAELALRDDFHKADMLILASGTWNTGGIEGQLNMHMHALLHKTVSDIDLDSAPVAVIGLGDERYHYTARATEHLTTFVNEHGGKLVGPPLCIINEPYDQVKKIEKWGEKLLPQFIKT